jgi:hypothetical protein
MANQGWLQGLRRAQDSQADWLTWIRKMLPEDLRDAPTNAIARDGELVVLAASAAWGTRLRYALAELDAQIRERAPQLRRVSVRVAPPER